MDHDPSDQNKDLLPIPGFHGVREALDRGGRDIRIRALWLAQGKKSARMEEIAALARERGIPVAFKTRGDLDRMAPHVAHQGIMAVAAPFSYRSLDEIAAGALQDKEAALLVALDHITDEGNLSSLIRTASFFGVHGMIIPKDRSAGISPAVLKRASGACALVPATRVVNMARTLALLDKQGFWIIGTSPPVSISTDSWGAGGKTAPSIYRFDWNRDLVLVLGNEYRGMGQAVEKQCHERVSIPSSGSMASLNVSMAGAVILSEISRQRHLDW
ncbi:MAG: 23S rRNA (guanosine(2251)-2'-O)-methyltransferase RlmB [Desulfatiglandaceae bacterium]